MQDPSSHQLTMTILMTPDMANFAGNVHGGTILKYLDQVAPAPAVMPGSMWSRCRSIRSCFASPFRWANW